MPRENIQGSYFSTPNSYTNVDGSALVYSNLCGSRINGLKSILKNNPENINEPKQSEETVILLILRKDLE